MAPSRDTLVQNLKAVVPLAIVNTSGYLFLNNHSFFPRQTLPLTAVDRAIPFLLWTFWPYLALLFSDVVLPMFIRDRALFRRMLLAYAVAISTNFLIWSLFPTQLPRADPPIGDGLTETLFRVFLGIDDIGNCFPSGHVTIPAVGCWAFVREYPRWRVVTWTLLILTSLTILTTKQHYAWDLAGGFGTAILGIVVSKPLSLWLERRRAAPVVAPSASV